MISKIKNFLVLFSAISLIASITSFTAFNWSYLSNIQKLCIPSAIMSLGILLFLYVKEEKYKSLSLFFSCFMIGILFAVFGQIYQTGADSWILFRNWAFFLILPIFLSMSYVIFSLFIVIVSLLLFFYYGLYFTEYQALYIACLFPACILLLYPYVIQKWKLHFHEVFYRSLLISFYIIFNFAAILSLFSVTSFFQNSVYDDWLSICLTLSYPLILTLLFFIEYRVYKKKLVLPFSVVSAGICIWTFLSKGILNVSIYDPISYFVMSLFIFLGTFAVLISTLPKLENNFGKRILQILGNFLKFLIFLFGIALLLAFWWNLHLESSGFLIIGLGLLALSCFFPKILHFKEDNLEIVSFSIGLFALNYFVFDLLESHFIHSFDSLVLISTLNIVIFDVFWYFRSNRVMDFLFAFSHYQYLFILCYHFFLRETSKNPSLYIDWIFILGLCILPLQIILEKKIENSAKSHKINRLFYGSNLCFLLLFLSFDRSFFGIIDSFSPVEQTYVESLKTILILVLSLFVFLSALKKVAFKQDRRQLIVFSVLLLFIAYLASYIEGAEYFILLLLLYTYKGNKRTSYLLSIALCVHIFFYYYSLSAVSLLQKSFYLFAIAVALFVAYTVVKFFGKEEGSHGKEME